MSIILNLSEKKKRNITLIKEDDNDHKNIFFFGW